MTTTKTKKASKLTRFDQIHQDIRAGVKGRDGKAVVDDYVEAIRALIGALGKQEAMRLHAQCGMLITVATAKEEKK